MCNRYMLMLFLLVAPSVHAEPGDGDLSNGEAWCDINPPNCVCSEPLTATDYIDKNGASSDNTTRSGVRSWNPNDTTSNQCGFESAFSPIRTYSYNVQPSDRVTVNNPSGNAVNVDAYATAALPNRVAEFTQRFMGRPYDGPYEGTNWVAHDFKHTPSFQSFTGRRAYRWYTWYPPDFLFSGGGMQNKKKWQSLIGSYWTSGPEAMNHHNSDNDWSCDSGSISQAGLMSMSSRTGEKNGSEVDYQDSEFQGVWTRVEVIVDQITDGTGDPGAGNGTRIRWMYKNVTNGDAEVTWTDSFSITTTEPWANTNPNGISINNTSWSCGGFTDLFRAGEDFELFRQNHYGQNSQGSSTLPKWRGFSYIQVAAWTQAEMDAAGFDLYGADKWNTTDFRIGSAYEMEGVAGEIDPDIVRPGTPSSLVTE